MRTAAPANASPPDNDSFAAATAITGLPFSAAIDLTEATTEPSEPFGCASIQGNARSTDGAERGIDPRHSPPRRTRNCGREPTATPVAGSPGSSHSPRIYANQPAVISVAAATPFTHRSTAASTPRR